MHLRPRTWEALCYLVARPGQLVTKDDLLDSVWADAIVSEGALTNSIRELRAALGDDARSPSYIETVHHRRVPQSRRSRPPLLDRGCRRSSDAGPRSIGCGRWQAKQSPARRASSSSVVRKASADRRDKRSLLEAYLRRVRRFANHFGRSPDRLGEAEVRAFLDFSTRERKASPSTRRVYLGALNFFDRVTLERPAAVVKIPYPRVTQPLPDILRRRRSSR